MPNRQKALILCDNIQWRNMVVEALSSHGLQCFAPRETSDLRTLQATLPTINYAFWVAEEILSDYSHILDQLFDYWPDAEHTIIMCQLNSLTLEVQCKKTLLAKIAHCHLSAQKELPAACTQVLNDLFPELETLESHSAVVSRDYDSSLTNETTCVSNISTTLTSNTSRNSIANRVRRNLQTDKLIVVASSTGGVQALSEMLEKWPTTLTTPIIIAHHLPARFQKSLGDILTRASSRKIHFVTTAMPLANGIYISPFDFHVRVFRKNGKLWAEPHQSPKEHFLRPAADPLFRSAGDLEGTAVIGIVLTGMGKDGMLGSQHIYNNGGRILCQDEQSSVVWGMPKQVFDLGITEGAFHPSVIGLKTQELFKN